jgi:hypothetical protein
MQLVAGYVVAFFGCVAYAVVALAIRGRWGAWAVLLLAAVLISTLAAAGVWTASEEPAAVLLVVAGPIALMSAVVLSAPARMRIDPKLAAGAGALGVVAIFVAAWTALILGWTRDSF